MTLLQRLGFFGSGLFLGIIVLIVFLAGKKTSCDYGPNARVLKDIRTKEQLVSAKAKTQLNSLRLDTGAINTTLKKGKVNFSESNTKLDSCKVYVIYGKEELVSIKFTFKNCNEKATLLTVETSK